MSLATTVEQAVSQCLMRNKALLLLHVTNGWYAVPHLLKALPLLVSQ